MGTADATSELKTLSKAQSNKIDRLILQWKRDYVKKERLKTKVDEDRGLVLAAMNSAGVPAYESKYGRIPLQKTHTTDWQALARSTLKAEFIEKMVPMFTSASEPYIRAPGGFKGSQ